MNIPKSYRLRCIALLEDAKEFIAVPGRKNHSRSSKFICIALSNVSMTADRNYRDFLKSYINEQLYPENNLVSWLIDNVDELKQKYPDSGKVDDTMNLEYQKHRLRWVDEMIRQLHADEMVPSAAMRRFMPGGIFWIPD